MVKNTTWVTASMRTAAWNVHFTIGPGENVHRFTGIYQAPGGALLTFRDVCDELRLSFELLRKGGERGGGEQEAEEEAEEVERVEQEAEEVERVEQEAEEVERVEQEEVVVGAGKSNNKGRDINPWTSVAFFLTDYPGPHPVHAFSVMPNDLDQPIHSHVQHGPREREILTYRIVDHMACDLSSELLNDHIEAGCAQHLPNPSFRRDPRYLPPYTAPANPRLSLIYPTETPSQDFEFLSDGSCARLTPTPDYHDSDSSTDGEPDYVYRDETSLSGEFRWSCLWGGDRCVVSGEGAPWCTEVRVGPGIEACNIIQGEHYHLYPLGQDEEDTRPIEDSPYRLRKAWEKTWSAENGILLMAHLREYFDTRLFSIHPDTLRVRVFVPYDALARFHGQRADVSDMVDRRALRQHYEMSCVENMAAENLERIAFETWDNLLNDHKYVNSAIDYPCEEDDSEGWFSDSDDVAFQQGEDGREYVEPTTDEEYYQSILGEMGNISAQSRWEKNERERVAREARQTGEPAREKQ